MCRRLALFAIIVCSMRAASTPEWSGSKACARCHPAIAEKYSRTPMARSSGNASESFQKPDLSHAAFSDAQSRYAYSVRERNGDFVLSVHANSPPVTSPVPAFDRVLRYFVGSGTVARTFLLETGGFLYESPATYYRQTGAWNFSPGYESYSYPFLTRAVAPGCLDCHATQVSPLPGTQNGYQSPPFAEGGVGCERCHGPGALHVRTAKATDIVNPARLATDPRDSVCAQCHLSGEVRVERAGRSQRNFRAGDNLSDFSVAFVSESSSARRRVTSHVENLAQSACKRVSGSRLWCGTCHDPHVVPEPTRKVAWFRSKCLTCHATEDCKAALSTRAGRNDDCTACHMPRAAVADAEHVVYTDHSIPRRPAVSSQGPREEGLVPFGGVSASNRDLGLAYAIIALRNQNGLWRERAFDLLAKAQSENPDEPQTLSYLADLYRTRGDDAIAAKLYERLLQSDPMQSAAPVALGGYEMQQGHYERAISLWKQALRISPSLVLVRTNLAVALARSGQREEAKEVLRKALEFSPTFQAARALLQDLQAGQIP